MVGNQTKSKSIRKILTNNVPQTIPKENKLIKNEGPLKKTESSGLITTRINKFKMDKDPETKNEEKPVEKTRSRVFSIPKKESWQSPSPETSKTFMKKPSSSVILKTSREINESSKQQMEIIPRNKLYYNMEGIKEENRSLSPRLFRQTSVFTGSSKFFRRKLIDKNPIFVKYIL